MLNFPPPHPGELLYSTLARARVWQGLLSSKQFLDEVFDCRDVIATPDLPNHLSLVSRWLPAAFDPVFLIYSHTLFPVYAPFVPENRRRRCLEWMAGDSAGSVHLVLGAAASIVKPPRFLRYCPGCLEDQLKRHGEYFWRREWQVAGFEACPAHGQLADSKLSRLPSDRHRYADASPGHCPHVPQAPASPVQTFVSRGILDLLALPQRPSPSPEQWTACYRELARRRGFLRGGSQIDHLAVREAVLNVWPESWLVRNRLFPHAGASAETGWLRAIFRSHRKSFSHLQHIVVNRALRGGGFRIRKLVREAAAFPQTRRKRPVSRDAAPKRPLTADQKEWQQALAARSPKQARKILPALYARLYRAHRDWLLDENRRHKANRPARARRRVDWEARDRELVRRLRQLSAFLRGNARGPRRTRTLMLRTAGGLAAIEKNLSRLPLTAGFLSDNAESVAEYQVRRLEVASEELRGRFDPPPRWRLLRAANLTEDRLTVPARRRLGRLVESKHENQGNPG